jgi:hypothetical protein
MARATWYGLGVLLLVAVASSLSRAILDLTTGLIAVAAVGGWAIGAAVRVGAWGGQDHRPSTRPAIAATLLGAVCWVICLVGAWLVAMAILPGSSRSFPDRLAATTFLDWVGPQLVLADFLDLVLFVGLAWVGARSASVLAAGDRP